MSSRRKGWGRLKSLKIIPTKDGFGRVEAKFTMRNTKYVGVFGQTRHPVSKKRSASYQRGDKFNRKELYLWQIIEPYILRFLKDGIPIDEEFNVVSGKFHTAPTRVPQKFDLNGQLGWEW